MSGRTLAIVKAWVASAVTGMLALHGSVHAEQTSNPCGPLFTSHYGPFDYRTNKGRLPIVEQHHFTSRVENLLSGSSGYLGQDLNYTLKSFPNHHRALMSLLRWAQRDKSSTLPHMEFPVDCYLERAVRFTPDDTIVRNLFARFLYAQNKPADARAHLVAAEGFANDNPITHFNLALAFRDIGDLEKAVANARKAASLGMSNPELERLLATTSPQVGTATPPPATASASSP